MKQIAIYLEGGGDGLRSAQQKADLRTGMDGLLASQKQGARNKKLGWRVIPCGGRQQAFDSFNDALDNADADSLVVLLVDSEDPISLEGRDPDANAKARVQHLMQRPGDKCNLSGADPKQIHLMVQCMEAWIVSDPEKLADHYKQGFHAKSLPTRNNLEEEPKVQIYQKLAAATANTQKGEYGKIKHASKLLAMIDPKKVAARCPRFATFTAWLDEQIKNA